MTRLGLIGDSNKKRISGVYTLSDKISYINSTSNVQSYGYDNVSNALSSTTIPEGLTFSADGTRLFVCDRTGNRTTASIDQYNLSTPWDISTAAYSTQIIVGDYDLNPSCLDISSDGTKMVFGGYNSDAVYTITLSTPNELSSASFDVPIFYFGSQDITPVDIYVTENPASGLSTQYAYMVGYNNDFIYQYSITDNDISTASYTSKSFDTNVSETVPLTVPYGIDFKSDGTVMFLTGDDNIIMPVDLSSPWDISTGSVRWQSFDVGAQEATPWGGYFKSDGTKFYLIGTTGDDLNEYTLSTPWDLTSMSFVTNKAFPTSADTTPTGVYFKDDGTKVYVTGSTSDVIRQYDVSVAWDLGSATLTYEGSFSVATQDAVPTGLFFKPDGTKMFHLGYNSDKIHEYHLDTPWDITAGIGTTVSSSTLGSVVTPGPLMFNNDGTRFYILDNTTDYAYQWSLTTPYDITSLVSTTPDESFNVFNLESVPTTLGFSTDGTYMYLAGHTNDRLYRVGLTSAWSIESCDAYFYTGDEESTTRGVGFSTDGTNMYVVGDVGDDINHYTLSTPWEIQKSNVTLSSNVAPIGSPTLLNMTNVRISSDGTKIYVGDYIQDQIRQIPLDTPYDITTMNSVGVQTHATTQHFNGFNFSSDGSILYIVGSVEDNCLQYNLSTPWDISTSTGSLTIYSSSGSVPQLESIIRGLSFSGDGNYLFFCGNGSDKLQRFALNNPYELPSGDYSIYSNVQSHTPDFVDCAGLWINKSGTRIYYGQVSAERAVQQVDLSVSNDLTSASNGNYITFYAYPSLISSIFGIYFSETQGKLYVLTNVNPELQQYSLLFL